MLSRQFPDQACDTTSAEFFKLQLELMLLDSFMPCTESLENSYVSIPTWEYPVRDRSKGDNTDFVLTIPCERSNANAFFFDGVNSKNETITLKANIKQYNSTPINTYYILNRNQHAPTGQQDTEYNKTAPMLCLVSDTFFIFNTGRKATYETTKTWNEAFATYFPQLFSQLASVRV
jgi:hypothetical protein